MAGGKIRGITIELGGNTSQFVDAIKKADKAINNTDKKLKDLNKLLKLDPGNSDLLKQKQEALGKAIEQTSKKSEALKEALAKMEKAGITDENREQYEALQRELVQTEDKLKSLEKESKNFGSVFAQQAKAAGESLKEVGGKITDVGEKMTVGLTAPIAGVAAASVVAWKEVDAGMDIIITKTGATGDALEDLQKRAQNIATTIPTSFEAAGTAIGEVNTRFGLMGDELEELSTQFIEFAEINGTDVNSSIDTVQQVLDAFNLSAADAGAMLDTLNVVGQNTGIGMDQLGALMVSNATAFQGFGLNAADAAYLLGELEKSGIDTSVVMTGMSKVQAAAMKDGISMQEEFENALGSSESAIETFGSKAGPKLYQAFENGTLSADMFTESQHSLNDALGSTADTYEATKDPLDQMTVVMNQLKTVGADLVQTVGPGLATVMEKITKTVGDLIEKWNGLSDGQKQTIIAIAGIVAAVGPLLVIIGKVVTFIGAVMTAMPALSAAMTALSGPIGIIIALVAMLAVTIFQNWDQIKAATEELFAKLSEIFSNLWSFLTEVWNNILSTISEVANNIFTTLQEIWTNILTTISNIVNNIFTTLRTIWTNIYTTVSQKVADIKTAVVDKFESIKTDISDKCEAIVTSVTDKFQAVKDAIKEKLDDAWGVVQDIVDKIKHAFDFEWKLPDLKVPTISVTGGEPPYGIGGHGSLPSFHVNWNKRGYADGLLFTEPTVLATGAGLQGFGDGNGAELVIGLNRLQKLIGESAGNSVVVNVNAAPGMSETQIADAVAMKLDRWLGSRIV